MAEDEKERGALNTDREIWRGTHELGNYYADSIHATAEGNIGINCGGYVVVMPVRKWHGLATASPSLALPAAREALEQARQSIFTGCDSVAMLAKIDAALALLKEQTHG